MKGPYPWRVLAAVLVIIAWALPAQAELRMRYEDAQVVERSELIVVAAIKEGSVVFVPHDNSDGRGRSWEYHVVLVVREVLKGECKEKELPIVIRYGLEVTVDGKVYHEGRDTGKATALPKPEKSMAIIDSGNSSWNGSPVADARQDLVWMLRHGGQRATPEDRGYGIEDPEDVQSETLKKYLLCYVEQDPEAGVRASMQEHPEIAGRALRYLEHRDVERIAKEADPAVRVQRLLPYYQSRASWGYREEAREAIIGAGEVAGPYLMAVYQETWRPDRQEDIIRMWGEIRYKAAADLLIRLLEQEDRFWASQELKKGWWNADVGSPLNTRRRDSYGLVYYSVIALGQIGEAKTREALELTLRRWRALGIENPQIVEAAEKALGLVGKPGAGRPTTLK